jgi:hypothetical protein
MQIEKLKNIIKLKKIYIYILLTLKNKNKKT